VGGELDAERSRAEGREQKPLLLSVYGRAEVIIAHTSSTLYPRRDATVVVEKSIARLAFGPTDNPSYNTCRWWRRSHSRTESDARSEHTDFHP
jgi:hypothetical protein